MANHQRAKVVVAYEQVPGFLDDLKRDFPQVEFRPAFTPADRLREVDGADVYYGWISSDVFKQGRGLRWVQVPGTGIDHVLEMTPELVDSDVVLTNSRGPHANPMADHTLGMVVALAHRFPKLFEDQKARKWDTPGYHMTFTELGGSTMGILALGDIGAAVARRAHGFGMRVLAVDARPPKKKPDFVEAVWGLDKLDDLVKASDWFVVTVPYTPATRFVIDRRRIGLMKQGARLIVVSRGGIVDEAALADALRSGKLAGAALDVTETEPLPKDSPLWGLDNLILSPHVSAETPGTFHGRAEIFKENLRRYLAGKPFLYTCDKRAGF
ncbi:MAG: D-2-hydroxyacid dehydrogenase [SAR202 cluster bacterium]|nr:D-2-hydroxyacid dehydrogenase [SAR202 cluster bacterium]